MCYVQVVVIFSLKPKFAWNVTVIRTNVVQTYNHAGQARKIILVGTAFASTQLPLGSTTTLHGTDPMFR